MGCGVSRFDLEEAGGGHGSEVKILRKRVNNGAVADSTILNKQMPVDQTSEDNPNSKDGEGESSDGDSKDKGRVAKEGQDAESRSSDHEEEKDDRLPSDNLLYPGSPSFRDYCVPSNRSMDCSNDSFGNHDSRSDSEKKCQSDHSKKGRGHEPKRIRIGRGFRHVLHCGGPAIHRPHLPHPAPHPAPHEHSS